MVKDIFHTLTFRGNNDEVLAHGPYLCDRDDAWLSPGYYFWEESIKAAHYWGTNRLKSDYIICKAECLINDDNCLDLVGNVKHRDGFSDLFNELKNNGYVTEDTTVGHVIDFLRKSGNFSFASSRIDSTDAFKYYIEDPDQTKVLMFDQKLTHVKLNLNLVVQICIFDLEGVLFSSFQLVHDSTDVDVA
ncbi:hypothetical protein [Sphingobacterium kitahiroshimense]|uniref:hypothetical protein n=1 Tax=Sphingobacterium kitahiroshimense TaxID=470446 RepID=UPI0032090A83